MAWLVPGGLRLDPADPDDLAGALLARLPDRPAAPGVPMSLPADALLGDGVTLEERARRLRRAGVSAHHVERLRAICAAPPERVATFGVAVRDAAGVRRHRGPRVVTVLDTGERPPRRWGPTPRAPASSCGRPTVPGCAPSSPTSSRGTTRDVAASSRRR